MMKRLFCFMLAISIMITVLLNVNGVAEENNKTNHSPKYLTGSKLTGTASKIYDFLAKQIKLIAEGKRDSTVFVIPNAFATKLINPNDYDNQNEYQWEISQLRLQIATAITTAIRALDIDYPLEMSWNNGFEYDSTVFNNPLGISSNDTLTIKLTVIPEFRKKANDSFTVDNSWVAKTKNAAENAKKIVTANQTKSDYQKLKAYKEAICELVDYNYDVYDGEWKKDEPNVGKILWVFDNDPSTKVVCEGYAKAYKYLCDLSTFNSDISVIYAGGDVNWNEYKADGVTRLDGHAWNVVHMDDGYNYAVDVTWADTSRFADDDTNSDFYDYICFLTGYDIGDVYEGFDFLVNEDHSYFRKYDPLMLDFYSYEQLDLAQFCVYLPSPDDSDYVKRLWPLISIYGPESESIQQGEKYPLVFDFPWNTNKQFIEDTVYGVIEVYKSSNGNIDWDEKMSEEVLSFQNTLTQSSPISLIRSDNIVNSTTDLEPGEYTIRAKLFRDNDTRSFYTGIISFTVKASSNPPIPQASYYTSSGTGQDFVKASNEEKEFVVKRSVDDNKTFSLFRGIQVDSRDVDKSNYEAKEGSVVITLKASYLETLNVGDHVMTVLFEDGKDDIPFTVSSSTPIITPTVTPSVTPGITPTVEPTLKPINPSNFNDVAVPSDSFTFKKVWQGDHEDSIDFTLYKADGSVYHHGFDKRVVSKTEWKYNAYFSAPAACYVIEKPMPGYQIKYVNVGVYADVTDRCCDGGTIINKKVPKTGDAADFALWAGIIALGVVGLTTTVILTKRKRAHK